MRSFFCRSKRSKARVYPFGRWQQLTAWLRHNETHPSPEQKVCLLINCFRCKGKHSQLEDLNCLSQDFTHFQTWGVPPGINSHSMPLRSLHPTSLWSLQVRGFDPAPDVRGECCMAWSDGDGKTCEPEVKAWGRMGFSVRLPLWSPLRCFWEIRVKCTFHLDLSGVNPKAS